MERIKGADRQHLSPRCRNNGSVLGRDQPILLRTGFNHPFHVISVCALCPTSELPGLSAFFAVFLSDVGSPGVSAAQTIWRLQQENKYSPQVSYRPAIAGTSSSPPSTSVWIQLVSRLIFGCCSDKNRMKNTCFPKYYHKKTCISILYFTLGLFVAWIVFFYYT